ncbi:MAG: type IV toxin-antitoxin system AbiEi family antitoxin [Deltaproteobacteria bacterium]|nr:type IV toxin-antitoxin system AbiEi family antitoxin [Deltaproteobacteria bacterium]
MSLPKVQIINHLLQKHVPGTVATSRFMTEHGVSKVMASQYVSSDWLERIGRGAYIRTGDKVDWQGALYSMQTQLNLSVHVGGLTALRLKGLGHYLPFTKETVYLFSDGREHLPAWFNNYQWSDTISHHNGALFELPARTLLSAHAHKSFEILISSPERAAFEMLSLVKTNDDFDAAMTVYEGLGRLRPRATQPLLEACGSVKVKRLFLWMAKHFDHPWLAHVDLSDVDLGKGKRMIYSGGKLDKEYLITVPKKSEIDDV